MESKERVHHLRMAALNNRLSDARDAMTMKRLAQLSPSLNAKGKRVFYANPEKAKP